MTMRSSPCSEASDSPYSAADLALVDSALASKARSYGSADHLRLVVFHDGGGTVCAVIN